MAQLPLRLDPALKEQIGLLAAHYQTSRNKLITRAIEEFLARETQVAVAELEKMLAALRRYRARDPDFEAAIADIARAEATAGARADPAEGTVVPSHAGAATQELRGLLDG